MRLALVAALLLVPLASADPAPTLRNCSSNHCVVVQDVDGDGEYDWVNVATVVGEQVTVNANHDAGTFLWHVDATTEEIAEDHATVEFSGESNQTSRTHEAWVLVSQGNHDTGESEDVALLEARLVLP